MVAFCLWPWHPLLFHPAFRGKGTGGAKTFAIKVFLFISEQLLNVFQRNTFSEIICTFNLSSQI
jgi:hypothetical protein